MRFKNRSHDLNVSTQAMLVLLLFENISADETLSYKDIQAATDLVDADLVRTLQSLACAKYRVLTKHPKGREVDPTDKFSFNEGFTCPLARIKIMQVAAKVETARERDETQEHVDEERRHMVEACIVRIMKNRKTMGHNELISEVAHQLSTRFNPSMSMIKKRIESLIDVSPAFYAVGRGGETDDSAITFAESTISVHIVMLPKPRAMVQTHLSEKDTMTETESVCTSVHVCIASHRAIVF